MKSIYLVRPNKDTNLFRKNQRCWVIFRAGTCDLLVSGKYRGRGRYIRAWINDKNYDHERMKEIEISDEFYNRIAR